jgi:hypothetical protein
MLQGLVSLHKAPRPQRRFAPTLSKPRRPANYRIHYRIPGSLCRIISLQSPLIPLCRRRLSVSGTVDIHSSLFRRIRVSRRPANYSRLSFLLTACISLSRTHGLVSPMRVCLVRLRDSRPLFSRYGLSDFESHRVVWGVFERLLWPLIRHSWGCLLKWICRRPIRTNHTTQTL